MSQNMFDKLKAASDDASKELLVKELHSQLLEEIRHKENAGLRQAVTFTESKVREVAFKCIATIPAQCEQFTDLMPVRLKRNRLPNI
jgi:hypothetical protein